LRTCNASRFGASPARRSRAATSRHRGTGRRRANEAFYASTIQARANVAWKAAGLESITPHEARHCAISYFIAAGLDWKQISTWAGHSDVRQAWNRYGHLVPGGEREAADRLSAYLDRSTVAQPLRNAKSPVDTGLPEYRYRDSKPASEE
jgi:integrase